MKRINHTKTIEQLEDDDWGPLDELDKKKMRRTIELGLTKVAAGSS